MSFTVQASDNSNGGSGNNVGAGSTVGLGSVTFTVAQNAALGPFTVGIIPVCNGVFAPPSSGVPPQQGCTSLSDSAFTGVSFTTSDGNFLVADTSSTPEPASLALAFGAIPVAAWMRRRR